MIVNALCVGWGDLGRGGNRWFAFDKATGATVWVSSPQKKHYDTNMSPGIITTVNGMKLLVVGGTDGTFHALKVNTGEQVWEFEVSKRAILTGAVLNGTTAYITHSEENLDTSEMGMLAAFDVGSAGTLVRDKTQWFNHGFQGGFASPVTDGERLYVVDNGAILGAFDLKDGRKAWEKVLGTIQKSSPVLADGKLYIGTENGKFFILKPTATGVEVLDEDWLGSQEAPEPVYGSPAVSGGRVFVTTAEATYAIGKNAPKSKPATLAKPAAVTPSTEAPALVQVYPYEVLLSPGEKATFKARLFDAKGNFIREDKASWTLDQLGGAVADGVYTASAESEGGYIKATVGGVTGQARVRVVPPLPWSFDFDTWTRRGAAEALDQHHREGVRARVRRQQGPDPRTRCDPAAAHPRVHGPVDLVQLHRRGRRTGDREAADTERRRRDRAALRAGAVWQQPEDRAAALAGRARPLGDRAVCVEARHVVPDEASGAERGWRRHRRARQGVGARRGRAGRLDHREERRHRTSRGRARPVFRSGQ